MPMHWGCKTLPLREAERREGWMTEWQQCARNKCSRTGAAGAQSFSRAACLYSGSLRHATRLLSGTSRKKVLTFHRNIAKGITALFETIFIAFQSEKVSCVAFFYCQKYILLLIPHVLWNAYVIYDDALWNGHVDLL